MRGPDVSIAVRCLALIFLVSTFPGAAPLTADDSSRRGWVVTSADVRSLYDEIFGVEAGVVKVGDRTLFHFTPEIRKLPEEHPLAPFVNENEFFLYYLLENWTGISDEEKRALAGDAAAFPENYYDRLRHDPTFNELVLPAVAGYLRARGGRLVGWGSTTEDRSVTLDRAADIAARFFYPDGVTESGAIRVHVCVGINGLRDLERGRDPYLESLAFAAINKAMIDGGSELQRRFLEVSRHLNELDLSKEEETKVTRAQGALWALMHRSRALREALLEEESRISEWLPVRLVSQDKEGEI